MWFLVLWLCGWSTASDSYLLNGGTAVASNYIPITYQQRPTVIKSRKDLVVYHLNRLVHDAFFRNRNIYCWVWQAHQMRGSKLANIIVDNNKTKSILKIINSKDRTISASMWTKWKKRQLQLFHNCNIQLLSNQLIHIYSRYCCTN